MQQRLGGKRLFLLQFIFARLECIRWCSFFLCMLFTNYNHDLFSSPKPKALGELLWSLTSHRCCCWRGHLSVCLSVHNFFKPHLLLNCCASFDQISQEWSLGGTDWKFFKDLESMQNSGCHSNQKKKYCKNLLVRNCWTKFNIVWQKCSFCDPLPRFTSHHDSSKNIAAKGGAYFPCISIQKTLKNLLVRNNWTDFNII